MLKIRIIYASRVLSDACAPCRCSSTEGGGFLRHIVLLLLRIILKRWGQFDNDIMATLEPCVRPQPSLALLSPLLLLEITASANSLTKNPCLCLCF